MRALRLVAAVVVVAALAPATASAATFDVTNTNDSGAGTLRQAITDANATTALDTINFNIAGDPEIELGTVALPAITRPVLIDGTTQPGQHRVDISGVNQSGAGLTVTGDFAGAGGITGLAIYSFSGAGIILRDGAAGVHVWNNYVGLNHFGELPHPNGIGVVIDSTAGSGNVLGGAGRGGPNVISGNSGSGVTVAAADQRVAGNYIGLDPAGSAAIGNGVDGVVVNATGVTVGGDALAERNVISGNGIGVFLSSGGSDRVIGNYLGTDATGTTSVPNGTGVFAFSANNAIGGAAPGEGNLISGNSGPGMEIPSTNNVIAGNLIGTQADGRQPLGNGADGIFFYGGSDNTVGLRGGRGMNTIAFNQYNGVWVFRNGTRNSILSNSIYENGLSGIDIGAGANDPLDPDTGDNDRQNWPAITSVTSSAGGTRIQGTLNSTPSETFVLNLFANDACDPTGNGEGQRWLTELVVTTGSDGNASFDVTIPLANVRFGDSAYRVSERGGAATITVQRPTAPRFMSATATSPTGSTSQFGNCAAGAGTSSVRYSTADAGATGGSDYTPTSGVLDFGAGETSKSFTVPIANDGAAEGPERVALRLTDPAGARLEAPSEATLTIDDDDSPDVTAASLTGARMGRRFRIGSLPPELLARAARVAKGTTISFTLSEPARVTFAFGQKAAGRRAGRRCVKPTARNRRARRCTRLNAAGSFVVTARQGLNRVRFEGRVGRKALRPGRYALALKAVDAAGNRSRAVPLAFTLLPARSGR